MEGGGNGGDGGDSAEGVEAMRLEMEILRHRALILQRTFKRHQESEPALLFLAECLAVRAISKENALNLHEFGVSLGLSDVVISNILGKRYGDPATTLTYVSRIFQLLRRWEERAGDSSSASSPSLQPLAQILRQFGLEQEARELEKTFHWLIDRAEE